MDFEIILTVLIGVGLSAASGFRVFIPFLIISLASISGNLSLSESFSWIGTFPALITFSVAAALEIAGYYIPWIDNMLDTIATPAAVIAGIILMASVVTGISPFLKWSLAIIAGGGIAATIQALTGVTRLISSTTTAGIGNPIVSSLELGSSVILAVMAVFIPVIGATIVLIIFIWGLKILIKRYKSRALR